MALQLSQRFSLQDAQGRDLGTVQVERLEGTLAFGSFAPTPAFDQVAPLFAQFAEAANDQLFGVVADLDEQIAALGLRLNAQTGCAEAIDPILERLPVTPAPTCRPRTAPRSRVRDRLSRRPGL